MDFGELIEKLIREAQADGKFDNLPGQGRPLRLDGDSEDSEWWAAHHLLKNSGHRPDWLEEDIAIHEALTQARTALRRSHAWRQTELAALGERRDLEAQRQRNWVDGEWALAQARFRETLTQLNRRIRDLNLKVPSERFQRRVMDVDAELRKVLEVK